MKWLAILALCCAAPAAAQSDPPDFGAMSDAELLERATTVITTGFYNACNNEIPLFSELARRNPTHSGYKSAALYAEALCVSQQGRLEEASILLRQSERAQSIPLHNILGLELAIQMSNGAEALRRLRRIARESRIGFLPADFLSAGFRTVRQDGLGEELEAFVYELASSSAFERLQSDVQADVAYIALAHAARTGTTTHVDALLHHVRSPYWVLELLSMRQYEPLWPQIEAYAGDNLAKLSDDYVAWTATRAADAPDDRDRLAEYTRALLYAGRFGEAVEVAETWLDGKRHEGEIEEGDGWALDIQASAYDALGQPDEADRVFDRLARISPDEHPWMVNFLINRAGRLNELGRWEEALAASDLARPAAQAHGTGYARMLVASYRVCAFHKLGRTDERDSELSFVRGHFTDAPSAGAKAMMCADRDDEAARLLVETLADERARYLVLSDMQDDRFDYFWLPAGQLRKLRDLVLARPELSDEVLKDVRLIPERFVPISHVRRTAM